MTVRSIIEGRMLALSAKGDDELQVRLAMSLKRDGSVRTSMLKRLSSSMRFIYGAKAGALKTAAKRSGSALPRRRAPAGHRQGSGVTPPRQGDG